MNDIIQFEKVILFLGIFAAVCIFVIVAIMLDLWDGIYTARRTGVRIHSHKLRYTIGKMSEYWRFIIIAFLVDCVLMLFNFYPLPFVVALFGIGLIIVEIKSMCEHARKRHSTASQLPDIISKIINTSTTQEAKDLIRQISDFINSNNSQSSSS